MDFSTRLGPDEFYAFAPHSLLHTAFQFGRGVLAATARLRALVEVSPLQPLNG
jgi:hypothetical protein